MGSEKYPKPSAVRTPEEESAFEDSERTPVICKACHGLSRTSPRVDGSRYMDVTCRFCTLGVMNQAQYKKWWEYCEKQAAKEK